MKNIRMIKGCEIKVSVVVGYYNRRDVLERTIASIFGQTFSDFEVLVFDDASTDGTAEALEALQKKYDDPRLKVIIHETNRGFVQGLIDAIQQTQGEYIAIHGSGDVAMSQRLEKQVAVLNARPNVGVVGCWYTNVNTTTGTRTPVQTNADAFSLTDLSVRNPFSHGEVMFRRSTYEKAGGYRQEFKFAQDIDLWMRVRPFAELATVPEFMYERYILSDGVTHSPRKFSDQARFSILARRLPSLDPEAQERALSQVRAGELSMVIPKDDPELQRRYIRGTINIARSGSIGDAVSSARTNIESFWKRNTLIALFKIYGSPIGILLKGFRKLARVVRRRLRRR